MTSPWSRDPGRGPGQTEQARSFGAVAEDYDRVRPGYPARAVRWALGTTGLHVLDLGAGTGKLTRVLRAEGHDVVAVDPDATMLRRLVAASPEVRALEGTAEQVPLPDACVDAALVAQAWHWTDRRTASAELARLVRPGGCAVLLWNVRDRDDPLSAVLRRALAAHAPELADGPQRSEDGVPAEVPDPRFAPDGTLRTDSSVRLTVPDLLTLVSTWSYVALSPGRAAVLEQVGRDAAALADAEGTVRLAQHVEVFRFRRA